MLLVAGGLLVRTLSNLRGQDGGFDHRGVMLVQIDGSRTGLEGGSLLRAYLELQRAAEQIPGVSSAAFARRTPLSAGETSLPVLVNGKRLGPEEDLFNEIGPRYFETLRTRVVLGREFTGTDTADAPRVAMINAAFARRYFGDANPIDQRLGIAGAGLEMRIVGVVEDVVYHTLRQAPPPTVYTPFLQGLTPMRATFAVRAAGAPGAVESALRSAFESRLPATALTIMPMTQLVEVSLVRERLMGLLSGAFAALALGLAAVGLYGLLAYNVARRTTEIGVRAALGAGRSGLLWLVTRDAAWMLGVGVVLGLPPAIAVTGLLDAFLFGLDGAGRSTIALAVAVLTVSVLAAAIVPARRAMRVDPMIALRAE